MDAQVLSLTGPDTTGVGKSSGPSGIFPKKVSPLHRFAGRLVIGGMTNLHAYGFLVFGGLLNLLPLAAPAHFPPNSIDGANTSALWLQVMGWVNGTIGAFYLIRLDVVPFIAQVLAWRPAPLEEFLPVEVLRPALALRTQRAHAENEQGMAA
jgi:hypothetical protein